MPLGQAPIIYMLIHDSNTIILFDICFKRTQNISMTVLQNINRLVSYGVVTGLVDKYDIIYVKNLLLSTLGLDGFTSQEQAQELPQVKTEELESILNELLSYAVEHNLTGGDSIVYKDLFDTKLMACLTARPSQIISTFNVLYAQNPQSATEWFYKFSQDTDYIRRYRVCKDIKWQTETPYGAFDITINLSKPEKDPKAIAAARNIKSASYPQCLLCKENVGYAGRVNHAARGNHRIIPLKLAGEDWGLQYSPYVYYNQHCIVFNYEHTPMKICRKTFERLLDFVTQFPHYVLGSNADLPIVGGSILTHDHFQGGMYEFPMAKAPLESTFTVKGFEDIKTGIVKWPMSVIRLTGSCKEKLVALADVILTKWRSYTDKEAFIFAETDGEKHNTITPIARRRGSDYELDLVLRNNITTQEHPLGVYHPHAELHHIKKENIGLIEVMGLAILPSRLKTELKGLGDALVTGTDITKDETLSKHADWASELRAKYGKFNAATIDSTLMAETGLVFKKVLEHAGVFKCTPEGRSFFKRFTDSI